ncbi:MAG: sigma-E factor negative regulatory protein RseB [Frankiaceae bacterium]|jgi:sigma-E factor negative regulatory protein RseB|nr:sigma-E factor negative regulatory protein RseB [Frankiaceae bacterium]
MRRGLVLLAAGGFSALLLNGSATALPLTNGERRAGEDGLALLEHAAVAARTLSYHGTQMVSFWSDTGSTSALIEVVHNAGAGLLLRVAPTPQNPGGSVYNDENGEVPEVVGFAKGTLTLLAEHYEVGIEGTAEVAGRPADVVAVRRPGLSPTARFWIDRATALPLRREVLDGDGRTLRESAFISLALGPTALSNVTMDSAGGMPATVGTQVVATDFAALRAEGWQVPERLGDSLELLEGRVTGTGNDRVLQLSYSDGVSTVSMFEQRGRLDTGSLDGWQKVDVGGERVWLQDAFPRRVVWSGHGTVFTVVADCPHATLDALVRTLPHGDPGPGVGTRLGHGLARVGSWFNPFG